jgi:hypothetical protein
MKPGIYHVKFAAVSSHNVGEGLAVFGDGKVNGGDPGYIYQGSYELVESKVKAKLHVKRWNPSFVSIFGNFAEFDLAFEGQMPADWSLFYAEGTVVQYPQLRITVNGRRLADAV